MKSKVLSLLLFSAATLSFSAQSDEFFTECSACTSSSDFETIAKVTASNQGGSVNDIFVLNPDTEVMKKIRVAIIRGREPGVPDTINVSYPSFESSELTAKDQVLAAKNEMEVFLAGFIVDPDTANSVYDLVGSTQTAHAVGEGVKAQQTWNEAIGHYTGAALSGLGKVVGVNWVIEVQFSDGSVALLKIDGIDGEGALELDFLEGRDSDGNTVPMTKEQFQSLGSYSFSGQGVFDEFSAAAMRFNVPITTSSGSGGSIRGYYCYPSEDGVVCKPN